MKTLRALFSRPSLIAISLFLLVFSSTTSANSQSLYNSENTPTNQNNNTNYSYLPIISKNLGPTYYVAVNGNDNNPGTFTSPWRTLGKASDMLGPGSTLYIRGGVYQEAVEFSRSGSKATPITILAYPGETPVIDGNRYILPQHSGGALLEISGNYITVSGLEVQYSSYLGVLVDGTNVIANRINSHHNLHSGMRISGDYSVIEYSKVWSNDMQNYNGQNPSGDSTALTASRNPNYAVIRHNVVHENWGIGLSTYESNGTVIEDNVVYDNYGPNVYLSDTTNVLFQRNFIYATGNMIGNGQVGIQIADEILDPPASSSNITIINNIVYNTHRNLACWHGSSGKLVNVLIANNTFVNSAEESGIVFKNSLEFSNVQFINNLIQQDDSLPIILVDSGHPGLSFSNNLWSQSPPSEASGPGDIIDDPLLAHTGDAYEPEWYKLTSNSPAIGNAIFISSVTKDYFEKNRLPPPDIGASEYP